MTTTPRRKKRPRRSPRIGVALLVTIVIVLIGGAVAAWALDGSKQDEIAEGVTIGGIDVGGMTSDEARRSLNSQLLRPLKKPIRVTYKDQSWQLPAKDLKIRGNIRAAINEAIEISRQPSLPSRVWRYVSGGSVDRSISPQIRYAKPAVNQFVRDVAGAIRREPVDAGVQATGSSVAIVEASDGVALRDRRLSRQIERALGSADRRRVFAAKTISVKPEVTTAEAAKEYPVYITVDRAAFELKLWKNLKLAKTYPIAVGQIGLDTPAGLYTIQNKAVDPAWHVPTSDWAGDLAGQVIPPGPSNPLKARWMGIYDGAGIHGTSDTGSLGSAASHGCVRMAVPDVIELYDQVPVGTPIYIG